MGWSTPAARRPDPRHIGAPPAWSHRRAPQCPRVETSAYLAPDRKLNVSIPRTSRQSKSLRLALAATGAAAAVAVLVSGGVAAAGSGPVPGYRIAAGGT